jgi:hypothetical protein
MSFGYEPPKQTEAGSWSEVFVMTKVAFSVLMPFVLGLIGLLLLFTIAILLFAQHPALALIPFVPVAGAVYWVLRRERIAHDAEIARLRGD